LEPKNSISIEEKINESGITLPETDSFLKIGDLSELRKNPSTKFDSKKDICSVTDGSPVQKCIISVNH
tara:strand:- start:1596 stop:1799 length:204 start_codon:yes stop_codon:yes gene_type:complete